MRNEVARQVTRVLGVERAGAASEPPGSRPTVNTDAYIAYQRGRCFWNDRNEASLLQAIEHFTRATELASNFAAAYAGLADAYAMMPFYGRRALPDWEAGALARVAARRAVALDSMSAEAWTSLASVYRCFDWDLDAALAGFQRAISLNPSYATARHWYGAALQDVGHISEAIAETEVALELDPLSRIIGPNLGDHLLAAGRFEDALQRYRQTLALDSTFTGARVGLADAYAALGRYDEALEEYRRVGTWLGPLRVYLRTGGRARARAMLDLQLAPAPATITSATHDESSPYMLAIGYRLLGNADSALPWLSRAFEERSVRIPGILGDA